MRIDERGNELRQRTVWLPVEVLDLIRADGLNLSGFLRQQLELYYGLEAGTGSHAHRDRLAAAARAAFDRQRQVQAERDADHERARAAVRAMRADRDAARARQDGIADALLQVVGDGAPGRLARLLPENDPNGDRVDDWDALVRRVSRLCGAEVDSAEVAAGLKRLIAAEA